MTVPADLEGRVALVTGSASGIGEATVRRLAGAGATVVVNSRRSVDAGTALAAELGGTYLQADVAVPDEARRLVGAVLERFGRLDILVNNAGTTVVVPHRDLAAATPEIWMELYATNVVAPFVLVTEALEALRAAPGGGVVVNVGSLAGSRPTGSSIPYAASKAALHHQTRLLAATLGPEVRVNVVAPGLVDTPWTADWVEVHKAVARTSPLHRVAGPDDVAEVIMTQIASPVVTGEVWVLDSGLGLVR